MSPDNGKYTDYSMIKQRSKNENLGVDLNGNYNIK